MNRQELKVKICNAWNNVNTEEDSIKILFVTNLDQILYEFSQGNINATYVIDMIEFNCALYKVANVMLIGRN